MSEKKTSKAKKKTTKKTKTKSNRTDTRVPIQLLVDYKADGHYLFDFCKDLGAGGVFIQTNKPLPQGSGVDLTFTIPDSKETLIAKGQVIWVQSEVQGRDDLAAGMGVQFSNFSSEQRLILDKFLERYSSKSDSDDQRTA